jgi:GntR family transcriptional regulator
MGPDVRELFSERDLTSLQVESPAPLYHQMHVLLRNRILDGTIAQGTRLPGEQDLAVAFGVSRITAKRALDELAAEELVDRRRGRGTHVTYHYEQQPVRAPLVAMLENLADMGRHTRITVLAVEHVMPPGDVRADLNLDKGARAWHVVRVRRSEDGIPFAYYESWTSGITRGLTRRDLEGRLRLEILRENGVELTRIEQYLSAASATAAVAGELQMSPGDPVLTLTRHSFDRAGALVDILFAQYHPKRFHYRMTLGGDDIEST